jgi:hypothetical protein
MKMIEGKTEHGFAFKYEAAKLNDWELLEDLVAVDGGDGSRLVSVLHRLLDDTQIAALKDFCRDENGRVPRDVMVREIYSIIRGGDGEKDSDGKN